jgi:hypothetical protein
MNIKVKATLCAICKMLFIIAQGAAIAAAMAFCVYLVDKHPYIAAGLFCGSIIAIVLVDFYTECLIKLERKKNE